MLNTQNVYKYLKSHGAKDFDHIWKGVKSSLIKSSMDDEEKNSLKTELYMSIMEASDIVINHQGKWDIRENYTLEEIKQSQLMTFGQEKEVLTPEETGEKELVLSLEEEE
ncbi:MAG: hypothetical protein GQ557_02350 [Mycoplasmataceae bacterium]|nr:hypothetical protein [Mycoplasmataceae bacterium]